MFEIKVAGKLYKYWLDDNGGVSGIRSESNPFKTPYLKVGSAKYNQVFEAIMKSRQEAV